MAISFPLREILHGSDDHHFRMATLTKIDTQRNTIETTLDQLSYNHHLVLAHGVATDYFSIANIERNSLPLKSVGEALGLRNQIYRTMEQAVDIADVEQRQST